MTGASKILTVSYGTFSCTLEGFDDPFNTMKAIAEYFRDLAAEDRYFGAEPPTPDAAMLHKIAEREIQRRVEAKVQENGVVLRASDGNAVAVVAEPTPKAEPAPVAPRLMDATPQTTETVAEKLSRLRAEVAGQPAAPAVTALSLSVPAETAYSVPEFVAPDFGEEDYDLPASVAPMASPEPSPVAVLQADDVATSIPADTVADTLPEEGPDPVAELPEDVTASDEMPVEAMAPEAITPDAVAEPASETVAVESEWDVTTVAQVADEETAFAEPERAEDDDPAEPGFVESEWTEPAAVASLDAEAAPAPVDTAATDALLSSLMADLAADPAPAPLPDDALSTPDAWAFDEDNDDGPTDMADTAVTEEMSEPLFGAADAIEVTEGTQHVPDTDEVPVATEETESIFTVAEDTAEPAIAAQGADEDFSLFASDVPDEEPAPAALDDAPAPDVDPQPDAPITGAPATDLRPDASEKLMRARARVIRIRRSDAAETAPAPSSDTPRAEAPAPATILSPEAEADLAAELAALSAATNGVAEAAEDIAPLMDMPAAVAETSDPTGPAPADTARRAFEQAGADDTISRLMAQADEHLEGPESKRRLSAIAHLKAAVAATVAERRATGDKPKDAEPSQLSRYRDDLAKVVRNKLGVGSAPTERLAPLVLVSEQRIDRPRPVAVPQPGPAAVVQPAPQPSAQPAGPVMPRRIAGASSLAFAQDEEELEDFAEAVADAGSFTEFAERLGAKSLGELIEASAAYLACVERREHFTRPQLMGLVQAALPGGDIPREDGLRSFGTLLRTGRIEKVRRGQFALSDQSAYLAEGRRIAG